MKFKHLLLTLSLVLGVVTQVQAEDSMVGVNRPVSSGPKNIQSISGVKDRVVKIQGIYNADMAREVPRAIENLSTTSKEPILIIINSPGGQLGVMEQVVNSIHLAQARGIEVKCAVSVLAASAAYFTFNECSTRYALPGAKLMFHFARVHLNQPTSADELAQVSKDMDKDNQMLLDGLFSKMTADMNFISAIKAEEVIKKAFYAEYTWKPAELQEVVTDGYLTVIQDIKGVTGLFDLEQMGILPPKIQFAPFPTGSK